MTIAYMITWCCVHAVSLSNIMTVAVRAQAKRFAVLI